MVFHIGAGTVVTGRVDRGVIKVGRKWRLWDPAHVQDGVYGSGDVPEDFDQGQAGDNIRVLLRGTKRTRWSGAGGARPGVLRRTRGLRGRCTC